MKVESLRALSVCQPWANLIAAGIKTVELRTWATEYRRPLAICAGQTIDRVGAERMRSSPDELEPRGSVVCVVELVDVRLVPPTDARAACAKRFTRDELDVLWAWVMRRARRIARMPIRGKVGLFDLNLDAAGGSASRGPLGAG